MRPSSIGAHSRASTRISSRGPAAASAETAAIVGLQKRALRRAALFSPEDNQEGLPFFFEPETPTSTSARRALGSCRPWRERRRFVTQKRWKTASAVVGSKRSDRSPYRTRRVPLRKPQFPGAPTAVHREARHAGW